MTDPILKIGQAGLETTEEKVKALTNRMVNAETPGFKGSEVVVRSFPLELAAAEKRLQPEKPQVDGTQINFTRGSLIRTGNPTDLALGADGFFTVLCPWGEGYTRDGRFEVDAQGRVVTVAGKFPLLGQNGPIVVTPGSEISISSQGEVKTDQSVSDRIRIVNFQNQQELEQVNGSIFKTSAAQAAIVDVESPRLVQGYVEASNSNVVDETMNLILLNRIFTLDTKIVSTRDAMLSRAIEMGKTQ
ncbi:flagellar hook basal-body protein [Candidatus Saganbacteria bacterium]|nr:flagellar hook basal-body protein [Candidatus Saganbacteria bacterium]